MQVKLFQRCTNLLYCSVLFLGGNVNTRRMSKPDMGSIFHEKINEIFWSHRKVLCELSTLSKLSEFGHIGKYYVNYQHYQNYQNLMFLTPSDTKRTMMHLLLFLKSRPERTGFNMYAECTQLQLTFLALHPCLCKCNFNLHTKTTMPDLQRYPEKLCLINYILKIW